MQIKYLIAPSLLSANMMCLAKEVQAVLDAGADMIHFDVMDNHYVPNLTLGPFVCQALANAFKGLCIDVHLMANPVEALIEQFAEAGAARISIHPEACPHLDKNLQRIRELGMRAGIVLNPATSPECLAWCLHRIDFVLVMTVNPGAGGQTWSPEALTKIDYIHKHFPQLPICVDGGVNVNTIAEMAGAGASEFVAGSAIFSSSNYQKTIQELRQQLP